MMACVTGGEPGRALDLLQQMKANKGGVNAGPDIVTYTSAIMACSSEGERGEKREAKSLFCRGETRVGWFLLALLAFY